MRFGVEDGQISVVAEGGTLTTLLAGPQTNHLAHLEVGFNRIQLMATESEMAAVTGILDGVGTVLQAT